MLPAWLLGFWSRMLYRVGSGAMAALLFASVCLHKELVMPRLGGAASKARPSTAQIGTVQHGTAPGWPPIPKERRKRVTPISNPSLATPQVSLGYFPGTPRTPGVPRRYSWGYPGGNQVIPWGGCSTVLALA